MNQVLVPGIAECILRNSVKAVSLECLIFPDANRENNNCIYFVRHVGDYTLTQFNLMRACVVFGSYGVWN